MYYTIKDIKKEINENNDFILYENNDDLKENEIEKINYEINKNLSNLNYNLKCNFNINEIENLNISCCTFIIYQRNLYIDIIDENIDFYTTSLNYYCLNDEKYFKTIHSLKEYLKQQYKTIFSNNNFKYSYDVEIEDLNKILNFYNDDIENSIFNFKYNKENEIIDLISTNKIDINLIEKYFKDYKVIIKNDYKTISNNIFKDLFENYVNDEIKDLFYYKNFKIYFDDEIIKYFSIVENNDIEYYEILDLIIENINFNYQRYLNNYYNLYENYDYFIVLLRKYNKKYIIDDEIDLINFFEDVINDDEINFKNIDKIYDEKYDVYKSTLKDDLKELI